VPVLFPDKMLPSLERLESLAASTILFGHGEPVHSPGKELFATAKGVLNQPLKKWERKVMQISYYSPPAWRELKQRRQHAK
jgi:glyoxylase-like metal-dependent hydrolase (beta-lactamase superfamily II)